MTNETWLTGDDFDGMGLLAFGRNERKDCLFAAAFCSCPTWGIKPVSILSPRRRKTLRLVADGVATPTQVSNALDKASRRLEAARNGYNELSHIPDPDYIPDPFNAEHGFGYVPLPLNLIPVLEIQQAVLDPNISLTSHLTQLHTQSADDHHELSAWLRPIGSQLIREIYNNPFSQISINPIWLTPTVTQLAQAIYNEEGIRNMPILADALQDAGCDNTEVLSHCRTRPEWHLHGCWALDLILGLEYEILDYSG